MKFFFVNHNQTHNDEVSNGYLWSPKTKSNGKINWSYENMKKVNVGDIVFSFAKSQIIAIGYATSQAYTAEKPTGFAESWNSEGWKVDVEFDKL